jgi:hypothetical protein
MQNYPTISLAKVRTLMNRGRRNPGRPGNSSDPEKAKTSKRVYGPQPGEEDVATLLFYRSAYPKKEVITEFLDKNELKAGAPVEVTPAFYRYRIHKVANFDKDSLKTYRLDVAPDVLVITGTRLTPEQRAGKKASSLEFRTRTLKAAGWSVTAEADRKRATADVTRLTEKLAKLQERADDKEKQVTKGDRQEYARIVTALRKKANQPPITEEEVEKISVSPNKTLGKQNIYKVLLQAVRDELKEAEKRASKIASAPAGKRALPDGITDEMLADYDILQKRWIKQEYWKKAGEIRSYAINKTAEFLQRLAKMKEDDIRTGGTGGPAPRTTQRASDAATAAAAEGEVELPRRGRGASMPSDVLEKLEKLAKAQLKKHAKTESKANVDKAVAFLVNVMKQSEITDPAEVATDAEDVAKAAAAMKAANVTFADASLSDIVGYLPSDAEPEVQENPRRRRPRTAIVPARTAAKWLKLKAVADKVDAAYHKMSKSYDDLRKIADLLGRLKRKRSAQADYARDQLQAEQTRVERRLVKETAAYKKAQATYLKAIKVANKKPKRRSR